MKLLLAAFSVALLSAGLVSCRCGDEPLGDLGEDAAPGAGRTDARSGEPGGVQVECPVCGLKFGQGEATASHEHGGKTYHFLLEDHQQAFAAEPARYLEHPAAANTTLSPDAATK